MEHDFKPTKTDLILSTTVGISFPFLAGLLYTKTGALLPMLIYYGLAWGLVVWRRKETGYSRKLMKPPVAFYINVILVISCVTAGYFGRVQNSEVNIGGMVLTAFIWALLNASSEQLLWIYIFESWDLYKGKNPEGNVNKKHEILMRVIGLILFMIYVGLIHTVFWVKFLNVVDSALIVGVVFVILTSVSGFIHIIVWRKSHQMFYTFIPHFILNFVPIWFTGYSILPYLVN